jgi:hypothetical protein
MIFATFLHHLVLSLLYVCKFTIIGVAFFFISSDCIRERRYKMLSDILYEQLNIFPTFSQGIPFPDHTFACHYKYGIPIFFSIGFLYAVVIRCLYMHTYMHESDLCMKFVRCKAKGHCHVFNYSNHLLTTGWPPADLKCKRDPHFAWSVCVTNSSSRPWKSRIGMEDHWKKKVHVLPQ